MVNILFYSKNLNFIKQVDRFFIKSKWEFKYTTNWVDTEDRAKLSKYNLLILDVLKEAAGNCFDNCRNLRVLGGKIPVLMLLPENQHSLIMSSLSAGADFYFCKPIKLYILRTALINILNRPPRPISRVIEVGNIKIDKSKNLVLKSNRPVYLRKKEYDILVELASNPGHVLDRQTINDATNSKLKVSGSNNIDVHISKLRAKLSDHKGESPIQTVYGRGYRLNTRPKVDYPIGTEHQN